MTRREWFLHVGGGVVLAGWSASDLMAAELPPGVYEPSRDHLSHALAGRPLAPGSETEFVQIANGPFRPSFFGADEYAIVLKLTGMILGESPDAPVVREIGAWIDLTVGEAAAVRAAAGNLSRANRTLAVHYFGADAVRQLEEFDAQSICREGLAWYRRQGSTSADPSTDAAASRFFDYLKRRVIDGFYTSRIGLEELGRGNPSFYASPPGCPA